MRVCAYNVENLFSRPRVLNLADHESVAQLLTEIGELKRLLDQASYAADKARIKALYLRLKDYVFFNLRSTEVGRYIISAEGDLIANGKGDWEGFIDFKRDKFSKEQVGFTAKVIKTVNADILALVEVESRDTLQRFNTDLLGSRYRDRVVIDGNDPRGINVALAGHSKAPILTAKTNVFARDETGSVFSRDCLEVEVATKSGQPLYLLVNHFKAKDRNLIESDARRKRQAAYVKHILSTRYDLERDWVIVLGDLNDEPTSDPLSPLLAFDRLHNVFDLTDRPIEDRWTYYYAKGKQRNAIDYLLVSDALRPYLSASGIERRGMAGLSKLTGGLEVEFDGIKSWRNAASDHGAVWADFDISLST